VNRELPPRHPSHFRERPSLRFGKDEVAADDRRPLLQRIEQMQAPDGLTAKLSFLACFAPLTESVNSMASNVTGQVREPGVRRRAAVTAEQSRLSGASSAGASPSIASKLRFEVRNPLFERRHAVFQTTSSDRSANLSILFSTAVMRSSSRFTACGQR
jgi:hypothetical protein